MRRRSTSFLDLAPERGLPAALGEIEFLDQHALAGYVTRHRSGLHLMGAPSKTALFARDLDANRFAALMGMRQGAATATSSWTARTRWTT